MKKIYLLFAMLTLIVSGAWAQPQAGKYYTLECNSGYAHSTARFISDDGTTLNGQSATGTAFTLETTATEGQYYLRSLASGKYVNAAGTSAGSAISLDATATTYWTVDNTNCGTLGYALRPNGTEDVSLNNNGGTNNLQVWTQTSSNNACSIWQFTQVTGSAYFNFSSSDVTSGETSAEKTCNDIKATVTTSYTSGLGSGTSTYSLTDGEISSLNTNVKAVVFSTSDAQSYISAGTKNSGSKLTVTISGLSANNSYNISLVTGLDFEGQGAWNSISSDNTVGSSNPTLGRPGIKAKALTPYIMTGVVSDEEGKIVLYVNNNSGAHTAVINCLGIYKATVTAIMNITDAGWATFCAPFAVEIPEGVKAYTATMGDAENTWVKLTAVEETTIPAGTPVVLEGAEFDGEKTFTDVPATTETTVKKGCLTGNLSGAKADVEKDADNYLLQKHGKEVGWYKVAVSGLQIGNNRCYMTLGQEDNAREFIPMSIDETTAIRSIAAEAATKADGKYLVNGKIVVVKAGKAYNMNGSIVK